MEFDQGILYAALLAGAYPMYNFLWAVNHWIYVSRLGLNAETLPPGDLGWPVVGHMISLFRAFKYRTPESFLGSFTTRYGKAPLYRAYLFGKPTVIVTTAEACRKVMTDDEHFLGSYPKAAPDLLGKKGLHGLTNQERKRLRQLIATPLASQESLSIFMEFVDEIARNSFSAWEKSNEPIEFHTEMMRKAFKVMMKILLSDEVKEDDELIKPWATDLTTLSHGLKSIRINLPGFAYHQALKARKRLLSTFAASLSRRKAMMAKGDYGMMNTKKDLLTLMMEIQDEDGKKLNDDDILDLVLILLLAGHESSGHAVTWIIIYLHENPEVLRKAREEQEEIVKRRESPEARLTYNEVKQMKYLQKVILEALRITNISFVVFREARTNVTLNGYTIPKGWRVLPWMRSIHLSPENHENPMDFNPSRLEGEKIKLGTLVPFGAGSRYCPGAELAKLEISVFLHYFLLNYRFERVNPRSAVKYLPTTIPADKCLARITKLAA